MTEYSYDELKRALAAELKAMPPENAERLSAILRGLFSCMQDLEKRLTVLEGLAAGVSTRDN